MSEFKEDLRSEETADRLLAQQTTGNSQRGQRVLRTAANGMQVWVPTDRLEAWEKAQEAQRSGAENAEARERRSRLASAIKSELLRLREQAQRR